MARAKDWTFTYFGPSTSAEINRIEENSSIEEGIKLYSAQYDAFTGQILAKGGKFVLDAPADGLSYYYCTFDPSKENFILQADVTVDYINPSRDGQEGFAIIARDTLRGSGNYLSNLFAVAGTRLPVQGIEVKDVLGSRAYTGIVDTEDPGAGDLQVWRTGFMPEQMITEGSTYRIRLKKNSSAYIASQVEILEDGTSGAVLDEQIYYIRAEDPGKEMVESYQELIDPLLVQEKDRAYLGFAVARGVNASFRNIQFSVEDWQAKNWKKEKITTVPCLWQSYAPTRTSRKSLSLEYVSNADGEADFYVNDDLVRTGVSVQAGNYGEVELPLMLGANVISIDFLPEQGYQVDPYTRLSSYEAVQTKLTVFRRVFGTSQGIVYVSPDGVPEHDGSSYDYSLDLKTALAFASPGQAIRLQPGKYDLSQDELHIARGNSGREDLAIILETDPETNGVAQLDFGHTGGGFTLAGDYWTLRKLAITASRPGRNGLRISGSHNEILDSYFYNNGNTGLQITSITPERRDTWPSNNVVRNCIAINNADRALADADGFAAKVACGEGNLFDSCRSAYNADDGFDLFAKAGYGSLGKVTIKNCLAYRNGFILLDKQSIAPKSLLITYWDKPEAVDLAEGPLQIVYPEFVVHENGEVDLVGELGINVRVFDAANGNGFKMGGTNLPGAHEIHDSYSVENKAIGFDSNSGPDIKIFRCESINNGKSNIALYTHNASAKTHYRVEGFLSQRTEGSVFDPVEDVLQLQGQEPSDVYGEKNIYYLYDKDRKD